MSECLPTAATNTVVDPIDALADALIHEVSVKFGLESTPLFNSLLRILGEVHFDESTPISPMQTPIDEFLKLVNAEAVVQLSAFEVSVAGIDIGDRSIAIITAKPGAQFTGSVAVSYVNTHSKPLRPFTPPSNKRKLAERQKIKHLTKAMETMLARVTAFEPVRVSLKEAVNEQ